MIPTLKEIESIHNFYTEIFKVKDRLPDRRGKKDNTQTEQEVISKSRNLISRIEILKLNSKEHINKFGDLDNIVDGCNKLITNPYCKLCGGGDSRELEEYIKNYELLIRNAIYAIKHIDINDFVKSCDINNSNGIILLYGKESMQLSYIELGKLPIRQNKGQFEKLCELSVIDLASLDLKDLVLSRIKEKYGII